jgi:hypothetical protein
MPPARATATKRLSSLKASRIWDTVAINGDLVNGSGTSKFAVMNQPHRLLWSLVVLSLSSLAAGPQKEAPSLTREFYEGFQRVEFDRWDAIIAPEVVLNSPAARDVKGLATFKGFAKQFTDLGYRIDLVDEHLALDAKGDGRGFVTFLLNWKHTSDFGGLAPTGREGTSVETCLFTIRGRKIVRIDVAAQSLDLAIYEWERNWAIPHNVRPDTLVTGVDRRPLKR